MGGIKHLLQPKKTFNYECLSKPYTIYAVLLRCSQWVTPNATERT